MDKRVSDIRRSSDTYSDLKELITNYRFRLGEHLNLTKLAERLGVSVTPVREALIRLNAESLVTFLPGRGFFPKMPNAIEQMMLYDLAFLILSVCLQNAAEERNVRDKFLRLLEPSNEHFDEAVTCRSATIIASHIEDTYVEIASGSGNAEFLRVIRNFCDRTHFIRSIELEQYEMCRSRAKAYPILIQEDGSGRAIDVIDKLFASTRSRLDGLVKEALVRVLR
ncbi:DNA-binding GntR family transcriptional regulator [Bradyrhizobium sp. USDA 4369]